MTAIGRPQPLMLTALTVLLAAASGVAFFARAGYPAELFSHFRPHYAAAAAGLFLLALVSRRWILAQSLVGLAALNAMATMAPFLTLAPPPDPDAATTRVLWANVQSNREALFEVRMLAVETNASVIALTERPADADLSAAFPDHPCRTGEGSTSPMAVVLLTGPPCQPAVPPIPSPMPAAAQRMVRPDGLTVVGAHPARPVNTGAFLRGPQHWRTAGQVPLRDAVIRAAATATRTDAPAVLVGDFNATPWSPISISAARGLMRIDCGAPWASTWLSAQPLIGLPIDYGYVTEDLAAECRVERDIGSDHRPLVIDVAARTDSPAL